jgi:hypothetical protein
MNDNNETASNIPLVMDNQGSSGELLSASPVLTRQEPEQLHAQTQDTHKKKSRGNRKLQRYRRRLRAQGLEPDAIVELVNQKSHSQEDLQIQEVIPNDMEVYIPLDRVIFFCFSEHKLSIYFPIDVDSTTTTN